MERVVQGSTPTWNAPGPKSDASWVGLWVFFLLGFTNLSGCYRVLQGLGPVHWTQGLGAAQALNPGSPEP